RRRGACASSRTPSAELSRRAPRTMPSAAASTGASSPRVEPGGAPRRSVVVEGATAVFESPYAQQADEARKRDVGRDGHRRAERVEQVQRNDRRGAAGRNRRELIAERRAAVSQPSRKALRDVRGLRTVLKVM